MFFTDDMKYAFRATYTKGNEICHANNIYECFYSSDFWVDKTKFERHIKTCGKKPGVLYDFNLRNVATFEDNIKYQGDVPFCVYADFETVAPSGDFLNPENKQMFAVSYSLVFAWHPKLKLPRHFVVRGYNHSLEQLSDMSYLKSEQLALRNQTTTAQLRDAIVKVHSKKSKNAIAEMFSIELKFTCDILFSWFKLKYINSQKTISNERATNYRRLNPISLDTECVICDFPLDVKPNNINLKENEMSYLDFVIKKEYSFLKNIYDESELKKPKVINNLENYHEKMILFVHLIMIAEIELKSASWYEEISDEALQHFLTEYCDAYEYDVEGLIENEIKKFKVSHSKNMNISKFTLQLYSFFYDCLMNFPENKFDKIKTVTANGFLLNLHRIINCKPHIHHSHVTNEIYGYAHDLWNWKFRENSLFIPLIGHNYLGFEVYYMVKGFRSSAWGTKDFSMGGTNLTNVNFANISSQIKIIDTLKYYQTTLANIVDTANDVEKDRIKDETKNFIMKHYYFSNIWPTLNFADKQKVLEIVSNVKGALPYEKIIDMNSLEIKPDNDFFEYTEFYSKLNGCNIDRNIYEDMKYLFKIFKMRNLGDLNDLYNMLDVILLCEIIENRFERMHEKFKFNPRKCNSASTLSGCVQRNQSKVIITLPTNYQHAEIFEKTLTGGYSCINTRVGFDTEILLLNFTKSEYAKMNIDESFKSYKNQNYKVGYKIKLDNDEKYNEYRVISKIIKFDENNQYGLAMTKPMPIGAIKEKDTTWIEFNLLFEKLSLDDKTGHIFVVDKEFDHEHATDCQIMYNELLTPFIDKDARVEANERSIYQFLNFILKILKLKQKATKYLVRAIQICLQNVLYHYIWKK